jgi:hypothetical protein
VTSIFWDIMLVWFWGFVLGVSTGFVGLYARNWWDARRSDEDREKHRQEWLKKLKGKDGDSNAGA